MIGLVIWLSEDDPSGLVLAGVPETIHLVRNIRDTGLRPPDIGDLVLIAPDKAGAGRHEARFLGFMLENVNQCVRPARKQAALSCVGC